ncbi:hypothetical protein ACFP1C_10855 [Levilactobacillus fujinensis]|uniref:Uncharacterized protein n=1 Tax=Levilactobacillus fujinensis TaxID=2486024 RepID=A0ABW1TJJ1_9LACO
MKEQLVANLNWSLFMVLIYFVGDILSIVNRKLLRYAKEAS